MVERMRGRKGRVGEKVEREGGVDRGCEGEK